MQIDIKIDDNYKELKVIILTDKMNDEVNLIVQKLSEENPYIIAGFRDNLLEILEESDIIRIYSSGGKIYADTTKGEYLLKLRLYELEERLDGNFFVRISNSEIINLKKVKEFDLSFTGTICVRLSKDIVTYVSRRYVSKIKKILGI